MATIAGRVAASHASYATPVSSFSRFEGTGGDLITPLPCSLSHRKPLLVAQFKYAAYPRVRRGKCSRLSALGTS